MNLDFNNIINKLQKIEWSTHCVERMQSRNITRNEVIYCLKNGEIIENYPDDYPYPSCLIYGVSVTNRIIHIVVGISETCLTIITVYEPNKIIFQDDLKTRR